MQKYFFKNLFWLLLINIIVKPIAIFFIDAQIQNKVGSKEYGYYFTFLNISYVFSVFLDFGISNFNVKKITKKNNSLNLYFSLSFTFKILLFILSIVLLLIFSFILSYSIEQNIYLFWIFFNIFLVSSISYLRSFYSGLLLFKMEIILSVLDKIFWILILGYWIYFLPITKIEINDFIAIQTLSYLLVLIIAYFFIKKNVGVPKFIIKWKWFFQIIKKSYPYALLVLFMMIYNRIDAVILERISGSKEAGIYAQSYRLLDASFMFSSLFTTLLFPLFSKIIHKKENILPLLNSSQFVLFIFSVLIANICFFYSDEIIEFLYVHDKNASKKILSILMLILIPLSFTLVQGTYLTAKSELFFLNKISLFGIVINIVLNIFLVYKYGALGATYSALITQCILALFQIVKVINIFKIRYIYKIYLQYLVILIVGFSLFYLFNFYLHSLIGLTLSIFIFLVLTIYLKIKEVKKLIYVITKK